MSDVCREFGISRKTGYKLFNRYRDQGLERKSPASSAARPWAACAVGDGPEQQHRAAARRQPTSPVPTRQELEAFVDAADRAGRASLGTAAMIGFYWLQREEDIFTRLMWSDYQPEASPNHVMIWHHKNRGERVPLPLYDDDGTELWPEMIARLESTPRHGPMVVMRDAPDRRSRVYLPWSTGGKNSMRFVQAEVRRVCREAGLPDEITFTSFRHGGHTEGADAELTDAQMRALGGHKTTAALLRYAKATERQRQVGARKRLQARTKKGILSE
jgi:hypothetical protein